MTRSLTDHNSDTVDLSQRVNTAIEASELQFYTEHENRPCFVDLQLFHDGTAAHKRAARPSVAGVSPRRGTRDGPLPFSGRPTLIRQLAPAFREIHLKHAKLTVDNSLSSMRTWFRLFDEIEGTAADASAPVVHRVEQITEVHRQLALDAGMSWQLFGPFKRVVNLTRRAMGLRPLLWPEPERPDADRELPSFVEVKVVRNELKRRWYSVLDRWERADQLLQGAEPSSDAEVSVQAHFRHLTVVINAEGCGWPPYKKLLTQVQARTLKTSEMLRCAYPEKEDVLAAFHLCLSTDGWNPQTLMDVNALDPGFIQPHPKDPARYVMRAFKTRSGMDQFTEGLYKTQRSPGVIILTLIGRTKPLRDQLRKELEKQEAMLKMLMETEGAQEQVSAKRLEVAKLSEGVRSPWLYPADNGTIGWISQHTAALDGRSYLSSLIEDINAKRPEKEAIRHFSAGDFRDAFAAFAYLQSGGMIYFVMRVLGHKCLTSTQAYIRNRFFNERSAQIFRTFSNALWGEIIQHKRVDPTVLASWTRYGAVSEEQMQRLQEYRHLRRSRLGIGCRDPFNPPPQVAPGFRSNGKRQCSTQRCTLCVENAVILPESLDGMAMRWAELTSLKERIPLGRFLASSLYEELENTEVALMGFDAVAVEVAKQQWAAKILTGAHASPEFELVNEGQK